MDLIRYHNLVPNEKIMLEYGELDYFPHYFKDNDNFFTLFEEMDFKQNKIFIFGKKMDIPRLEIWFGDKDYTYSGNKIKAQKMPREIEEMMNEIMQKTGCEFNSVLINKYRNGQDYASWHADNEKELGDSPVIASVSFGASRKFVLKGINKSSEQYGLLLQDGDLLIMHRGIQEHYKHSLLKTSKKCGVRYNLTFRFII